MKLFGLNSRDDESTWSQQDLLDNDIINKYFQLRPRLLKLSYPLNDVRKIKIDNIEKFKPKDLITLLSQFARLYDYCVTSYTRDIKPNKNNNLRNKKSYQVYSIIKLPI